MGPISWGEEQGLGQQLPHPTPDLGPRDPYYRPRIRVVAGRLPKLRNQPGDDLEDWRPYSVFKYYGSAIENGIDWTHFASITLAALVLTILAALVFRRRDIYT